MFDRGAGAGSTVAPFWLRVEHDALEVEVVEVGAHSLPEAYRKALSLGIDPTTWVSDGRESPIPGGLDHMRRSAVEAGSIAA